MIVTVVSGGFDPLHSGHLDYINSARNEGDKLIVCLNSDSWLVAKKGKAFLPFKERKKILLALRDVDDVISFDDSDGTCMDGLKKIRNDYPNDQIIFCNGGDRNKHNIPEFLFEGIGFKFCVGGNTKKNSSSSILASWQSNSEERTWGRFNTFLTKNNLKIKELIIDPQKGLSFQRHQNRMELWLITEGCCEVFLQLTNEDDITKTLLQEGDAIKIPMMAKHQLINPTKKPCHIIEIQYGIEVNESDIERFFYYPKIPLTV